MNLSKIRNMSSISQSFPIWDSDWIWENVQIVSFVSVHLEFITQVGILQCFRLVACDFFFCLFYKLITSLNKNNKQTFFDKGDL